MSTRSMTLVAQSYDSNGKSIPLYRHCDGYPAEAGAAIVTALNAKPTDAEGHMAAGGARRPGARLSGSASRTGQRGSLGSGQRHRMDRHALQAAGLERWHGRLPHVDHGNLHARGVCADREPGPHGDQRADQGARSRLRPHADDGSGCVMTDKPTPDHSYDYPARALSEAERGDKGLELALILCDDELSEVEHGLIDHVDVDDGQANWAGRLQITVARVRAALRHIRHAQGRKPPGGQP